MRAFKARLILKSKNRTATFLPLTVSSVLPTKKKRRYHRLLASPDIDVTFAPRAIDKVAKFLLRDEVSGTFVIGKTRWPFRGYVVRLTNESMRIIPVYAESDDALR